MLEIEELQKRIVTLNLELSKRLSVNQSDQINVFKKYNFRQK